MLLLAFSFWKLFLSGQYGRSPGSRPQAVRRMADFLSSPAGPIFAAPVVDIVEDDEPRMRPLPQTVTCSWVGVS